MRLRASYEVFSKVWPDLTEFADGKESVHPGYKAMPKYVVWTTLTEDDLVDNWGARPSFSARFDEVAALKEARGGQIIIYGSATLARNPSDAGLIDRYDLLVFPVLLGAGKGMFSDTDKDKAEAGVGRERDRRQRHPEARLRRGQLVPDGSVVTPVSCVKSAVAVRRRRACLVLRARQLV